MNLINLSFQCYHNRTTFDLRDNTCYMFIKDNHIAYHVDTYIKRGYLKPHDSI